MKPTHGTCDQFMAEGQPCSGWQAQQAEIERLRAIKAAAQAIIDYLVAGPDDYHGDWLHWSEKFEALREALK